MLMGVSDRDEHDGAERHQHRHATHDDGHAGRDHAPEHEQQREAPRAAG